MSKATGFVKEFRDFAVKGNAVDLAVGVIIGAAFGRIVDSLVKDIVMPLVNFVLGGSVDFSNKFLEMCIRDRSQALAERGGLFLRRAVGDTGVAETPQLLRDFGHRRDDGGILQARSTQDARLQLGAGVLRGEQCAHARVTTCLLYTSRCV